MRIGLTGGIGCGKSTVGKRLAEAGFRRIDTDELAKRFLSNSAEVHQLLRERWGEAVFNADGTVSRPAIAQRVFAAGEAGEQELRWLESVLHPRVHAEWRRQLEAEPEADWVVEIPLLVEKKLEKHFNIVVCVTTSRETSLKRLEGRGIQREDAEARTQRQAPLETKQQAAHYVLSNDGTLATLHAQVDRLLDKARLS